LHGILITLKDVFDTTGIVGIVAMPIHANRIPMQLWSGVWLRPSAFFSESCS
jgi:hypothetical protein